MKSTEQTRFDKLYKRHLRALKLWGMSDSTIDGYARAGSQRPAILLGTRP